MILIIERPQVTVIITQPCLGMGIFKSRTTRWVYTMSPSFMVLKRCVVRKQFVLAGNLIRMTAVLSKCKSFVCWDLPCELNVIPKRVVVLITLAFRNVYTKRRVYHVHIQDACGEATPPPLFPSELQKESAS